jgi:hypothetical protein
MSILLISVVLGMPVLAPLGTVDSQNSDSPTAPESFHRAVAMLQIFHARSLAATPSLADQSYQAYLATAEVLEQQFGTHPHHPGVAHDLIHSDDAPPIAPRGLPAARRDATTAPSGSAGGWQA